MRIGKVTVRAGFVLLLTVLVWLDRGGLLLVVFAAAVLHELGHYIPLKIFGGRIYRLELNGGGVEMEASQPMGYGRELLTILGGPFASICFALLFSMWDGIISKAIVGMCFSHAVFNLLPMRGLDGGRTLELLLNLKGVTHVRLVLNITTAVTAAALGVLCAVLAISYKNISLLLAVIYVGTSAATVRKNEG